MRLSHAETQALISARLDGPLDPVAERELNAHLATCESCRAFNASASNLARGLQSLPYLPASPAVTRAVLDHVSTPRSAWSWLPANALPAATAIAAAVIVVFVGSFAAFQFLDEDDEPSMLPASTLTVTDLAQGIVETAEATQAADTVEAQTTVTEEAAGPAERNPATEPAAAPDGATFKEGSTESSGTGPATNPATETDPDVIEPQATNGTSDTQQPLLATEEPATEPAPEPTEIPAPTAEPTPEPPPTLSASIRQALGLETAVPTEEATAEPSPTTVPTAVPTAQPTPEPTIAPTPTDEPSPTTVPTIEPTATEAPTATATTEPTAEPTATVEPTEVPADPTTEPVGELGDNLQIVGPPDTATAEPALEPTSEPAPLPTTEPTAEPTPAPTEEFTSVLTATLEPTSEPTAVPTEEPTPVPTEQPEPTQAPEPTAEQEPTVVPIESRPEDEDEGNAADDSPPQENEANDDAVVTNESAGDEPPIINAAGSEDIAATPNGGIIEENDDDGPEQVIEPAGGNDPADVPDGPEDGTGGDNGQGGPTNDSEDDGSDSRSLADADVFAGIGEVPGDPTARLGISAGGDLIFSSNPGQVSLEQDGVSLETAVGATGQVVQACADGFCVDISGASATTEGHVDNPVGWLGGEVVYERLNGDQYAVEYLAITLDTATLTPLDARSLGGGDAGLERLIRPYTVDGALLVPAPAGWLRITPSSVEVVDGNPYGGDLNLIRINPSAGQISYVSGGNLILASIESPGSPSAQLPFSGSDYDVSPDGSRIAVVTGGGVEIWDTSGNVLTTYPAEGIQIGSLAWLDEGLVVVDLRNGVLRIVTP